MINLSRLHVVMIYLIPPDDKVAAFLSILLVKVIKMLVSLPKLVDHELLEAYDVDDIKEALDLIKDKDAELISSRTIAILSHCHEQATHNLATSYGIDIFA